MPERERIKGNISDSQKNLKNPSEKKKMRNACQLQHVPFFLKKRINLTGKQLSFRFHSVGHEPSFSPWEISLNYRIRFCVFLSIKKVKPLE